MVRHLDYLLDYQIFDFEDFFQIQYYHRNHRNLRHQFLNYLTAGVAVVAVGTFLSALVPELL